MRCGGGPLTHPGNAYCTWRSCRPLTIHSSPTPRKVHSSPITCRTRARTGAQASAPLPDLAVYVQVPTSYPAAAPATFAVTLYVHNFGSGAAPATVLQGWNNWPGGSAACGAVGDFTVKVPPIKAGGVKTLTKVISLPAGGATTVYAFVDDACAVAEADETNNQAFDTVVTVLATPQPVLSVLLWRMPDLYLNNNGLAAVNGSLTLRLTVQNRGAAAAKPSTVRIWTDVGMNAPALTCANAQARPPNATLKLGAIKAGGYLTTTVTGIPVPQTAGQYAMQLFLDAGGLAAAWLGLCVGCCLAPCDHCCGSARLAGAGPPNPCPGPTCALTGWRALFFPLGRLPAGGSRCGRRRQPRAVHGGLHLDRHKAARLPMQRVQGAKQLEGGPNVQVNSQHS